MTTIERMEKQNLPRFFAVVDRKNDRYEFGLHTKNATWKELSYLLACLKIIEKMLVEHLDAIEPEWEVSE